MNVTRNKVNHTPPQHIVLLIFIMHRNIIQGIFLIARKNKILFNLIEDIEFFSSNQPLDSSTLNASIKPTILLFLCNFWEAQNLHECNMSLNNYTFFYSILPFLWPFWYRIRTLQTDNFNHILFIIYKVDNVSYTSTHKHERRQTGKIVANYLIFKSFNTNLILDKDKKLFPTQTRIHSWKKNLSKFINI